MTTGLDVVSVEGLRHRPLLAFGPADLGVRRQIIDRAFDQRLDAAAVNIDRLGLLLPLRHQQGRETGGMVAVRVRDENLADFAKVVAGLHDTAGDAAAGIDQIERAVDDQQVGGLRPVRTRQWAAGGAERDERRLGLGRTGPGCDRRHRQAGGHRQQSALFCVHANPPCFLPCPFTGRVNYANPICRSMARPVRP